MSNLGGRPEGPVRAAIREALAQGPGTSLEVRIRAMTGKTATMHTLHNMCVAGEVKKLEPTRRPGVKRPVPVYALVNRSEQRQQLGSALEQALRGWSRPHP